ncbi:MAG: tetratricopeptide repeat protein [Acidobacteria bacterium]|nr:tetratricopeptide repeat protein [Acidobacteriota bacterium]
MFRRSAILLLATAAWAETGSRACAPCHAEIYRKYKQTGMARSSGRTGDGLESFANVTFTSAGAQYRVTPRYAVEFSHGDVKGSRAMEWFIGSGAVGRSYAGFVGGFLFQSPASYYSARKAWDISPGFRTKPFVDVARPIESPCLHCHSSGAKPMKGTENKYSDPPFAEGGVSCERCHGAGEEHVTRRSPIINPAKLAAARRDSVCLQCHLTGAARVARPGRGPGSFRPGDLLNDHITVFVWSRPDPTDRAATDHAEQLARSRCQQAAGDKLWCGTCHDAHSGSTRPPAATCLQCHSPHKDRSADCFGCHMPKGQSREGEHVVYTDHSIARRPGTSARDRVLQVFRGMKAGDRDWALAQPSRSVPLLEKLALNGDAAVLVQLAQQYDAAGLGAAPYQRALKLDPDNATAQANLGIYRIRAGRVRDALDLWRSAFDRNPSMIGAGLNLATGQLQAGDRPGALTTLGRILQFHPDNAQARQLLLTASLP